MTGGACGAASMTVGCYPGHLIHGCCSFPGGSFHPRCSRFLLIEFVTAWRLRWLRLILKVMCDPNLMSFVLTSVSLTASLAGVMLDAFIIYVCRYSSEDDDLL